MVSGVRRGGPFAGRGVLAWTGGLDRAQVSRLTLLSSMELIARTGYQAGKSPILPVFAASIGASAGQSGVIVAVSAATGLATSPLIGALSDRYGRALPLTIGTVLFAFVPLLYLLVVTSGQLVALRLVHGCATATYGPVITAAVADSFRQRTAGAIGWYRSVRTAAYLFGPLLGGAILMVADPRLAWVAIAALSSLAFVPGLVLARRLPAVPTTSRPLASLGSVVGAVGRGFRDLRVLLLGGVQIVLYAGLRGNSAFLPLWGLAQGLNEGLVGLILGVQVFVTLLGQPVAGRLGDRLGERAVLSGGLVLVGGGLALVGAVPTAAGFGVASVAFGLGEAVIAPNVGAAATRLAAGRDYGGRLGVLEATDNIGKVLGPIVVGLLIGALGYGSAYLGMAVAVLAVAGGLSVGLGRVGRGTVAA